MTTPARGRFFRPPVLLLFNLSLLLGCGAREEIRSYTVAKEKSPAAAPVAATAGTGQSADRMLGAIVPAGDQSWFFKVTGPKAAVDKNTAKIQEFFQTIQFRDGAEKPTWKTPEGWEELGPSGMRAATLKIPTDAQPLEMSVIASSGTLIDNVNRWRGQLQLPPVDEKALAESVTESKAGDAQMWLVDLTGKSSGAGMMAPFAGGPFSAGSQPAVNAPVAGGQNPAATPGATPSGDLPPGHPPIAGDSTGGPAAPAALQFTAPESWQSQPASGMRKAAFQIKDGDKQAEVTVIDLLASAPSIADPLQNINMWRSDLGLEPVTEDQVAALVQKVEIDGKPGNYVELIPDTAKPAESQVTKATFAAAVPAGQMIWFIKMKGDRDLVVAQRDHFKSFLESIRFDSDGGADHGNK